MGDRAAQREAAAGKAQGTRPTFQGSLTQAQQTRALELLGQPDPPTVQDVARQLNVSAKALYRLTAKAEVGSAPGRDRAARYRRRLDKQLPASERARLIAMIAKGEHPDASAALKAIEHVNEVTEIVRRNTLPPPASLFMLPPDADIGVGDDVLDGDSPGTETEPGTDELDQPSESEDTAREDEGTALEDASPLPPLGVTVGNTSGEGYARTWPGTGRRKEGTGVTPTVSEGTR